MGMVDRFISEQYAANVRRGVADGLGSRLIAQRYGMHLRTVQRIRKRLGLGDQR